MKTLLGYSKYDTLMCFIVDNDKRVVDVFESCNRINQLGSKRDDACGYEGKGSFAQFANSCIIPQYLTFNANDLNDLDVERSSIPLIKTTQIIFVLPPLVDWDIHRLRAAVSKAGWINKEDEDNDSKLMLVPFMEAYVNFLQLSKQHKEHFEREGKYMLLQLHPLDGDRITYTATCFQMQCAKELIAVSKKLASSDFHLVPTILSNRSISLPDAVYHAVLEKMKRFRDDYRRISRGVNVRRYEESDFAKLAMDIRDCIIETDPTDLKEMTFQDLFPWREIDFERYQLGYLRYYGASRFVKELCLDAKAQQHTRAVCHFLQESLDEYGLIKNTPDGIRKVFLFNSNSREEFYLCGPVENALLQAKLIENETRFTEIPHHYDLAEGAMLRPLKIAQIVNSILPPLILNGEETEEATAFKYRQESDNGLLPLNSFYLQANIGEQQINFILNKVVKAPTIETTVELFTAEERSIDLDNIQTTTYDNLWSHYQLLESEGRLNELIGCCQAHQDDITLSLGHYQCFSANITSLIHSWLREKSAISNEELDTYHLISVDSKCTCTLKISHRMLLDIGLKPSISSIAQTIVGTILSPDHFGRYYLSALFVKGDSDPFDRMLHTHSFGRHLKESLEKFFQTQQRYCTTIFVDENTVHAIRQYLVRGNYTQVSSSTYAIAIDPDITENTFAEGPFDGEYSACKYFIFGTEDSVGHITDSRRFEYTILNKGELLPGTGVEITLFFSQPGLLRLDLHMTPNTARNYVPKTLLIEFNTHWFDNPFYITIIIKPIHHSSTLNIAISGTVSNDHYYEKKVLYEHTSSTEIQERLVLKRL